MQIERSFCGWMIEYDDRIKKEQRGRGRLLCSFCVLEVLSRMDQDIFLHILKSGLQNRG